MKGDENLSKKLILSLLGISLFPIINSNLILESEASNTSKTQEDLSPLITYTTEKIGDREKMKVTVTVEDRSGSGIKEFRDYNNNLISGTSKTIEFNKRVKATFTAIDNNDNKSEISINLDWVNPYTSDKDNDYRIKNGSTYWSSSNLREWLNSANQNVSYTCNPPTNEFTDNNGYSNEAGFLSQFKEEEVDAILKTKHLVWTHDYLDKYAVESGGGNPGHLNTTIPTLMSSNANVALAYKKYAHKTEIDKVYLLSAHEVYWYLNRRGFELKKIPTKEIQNKYKLNSKPINWYLTGTTDGGGTEFQYAMMSNGTYKLVSNAKKPYGIVPAININPAYRFSNGLLASDLNIGDVIEFGRYLNTPIEWQVVNISNNGTPLLLTLDIIDYKPFDAKGDKSRMYSDYINFKNHDIDLSNDVEYKPTYGSEDIDVPTVTVLNEDELNKRHNKSFALELEFHDESGIKYIEKPDGTITTETRFSYDIFENNEYIFKCMDNAGNYNEFGVPVSNINQEAVLDISQSETDWSNRDVLVNIMSSNSVKQIASPQIITNYIGNTFPNYISYSSVTFNVSGIANLISYDPIVLEQNALVGIGFFYHYRGGNNGYSYTASPTWNYNLKTIPLNEIIEKRSVPFNFTITVPGNYYKDLSPCAQINLPHTLSGKAKIELTDLTYSLTDDSDFAINSIELPSGESIKDIKEYTDIITEDGIHNLTYKVVDNRGKVTQKTITVKVDKTVPTLDLNYNTNITNQNITVNINASDATSGVKRIKLPNGNYITNSNSTYTISGDGEYTFECEDVAGNITTKTITINNIDKEKPSVVIDKNNIDWTNKPVKININSRD